MMLARSKRGVHRVRANDFFQVRFANLHRKSGEANGSVFPMKIHQLFSEK